MFRILCAYKYQFNWIATLLDEYWAIEKCVRKMEGLIVMHIEVWSLVVDIICWTCFDSLERETFYRRKVGKSPEGGWFRSSRPNFVMTKWEYNVHWLPYEWSFQYIGFVIHINDDIEADVIESYPACYLGVVFLEY